MNASATISNGRTVEENGSGMVCIHFFGPLCILEQCCGGNVVSESENIFWELFLDASVGSAVLKFGTQSCCTSRHIMEHMNVLCWKKISEVNSNTCMHVNFCVSEYSVYVFYIETLEGNFSL
jgi:hypothetical protein